MKQQCMGGQGINGLKPWRAGVVALRYDLTDTAGVLENKVLGMFHGLDDFKWMQEIARR